MVFERPIASTELGDAEVGITAVCWARIPGRSEALLGSIYFDRDDTSPVFDKITPNRRVAETEPRLVYGHGGEFTWAFGDNEGAAPGAQFMRALAPRLRAAWLLMQQPLVDTREVQLPRPTRRRLQRAGHEPPPVRLIEVRRPEPAGGGTDVAADRGYHHRWIVRGH